MPILTHDYQPWEGKKASWISTFLSLCWMDLKLSWRNQTTKKVLVFMLTLSVLGVVNMYLFFIIRYLNIHIVLGNTVYKLLLNTGLTDFTIFLLAESTGLYFILRDLKYHGYYLYFSKPVSIWKYMHVKILSMFLLIFGLTFLPAFVFWVTQIVFAYNAGAIHWFLAWQDLGSIILNTVCLALPTSILLLAVSSLFRSSLLAGVVWFVFYYGTNIVARIFSEVLDNDQFGLLSYLKNLRQINMHLYRLDPIDVRFYIPLPIDLSHLTPTLPTPWLYSLGIILGLTGLGYGILLMRLTSITRQG